MVPGVDVAGFVDRLRDVDDVDVVVDVFNGVGVDFSSVDLTSSLDGVDARESLSLPVTEPSFFGFGAVATLHKNKKEKWKFKFDLKLHRERTHLFCFWSHAVWTILVAAEHLHHCT